MHAVQNKHHTIAQYKQMETHHIVVANAYGVNSRLGRAKSGNCVSHCSQSARNVHSACVLLTFLVLTDVCCTGLLTSLLLLRADGPFAPAVSTESFASASSAFSLPLPDAALQLWSSAPSIDIIAVPISNRVIDYTCSPFPLCIDTAPFQLCSCGGALTGVQAGCVLSQREQVQVHQAKAGCCLQLRVNGV